LTEADINRLHAQQQTDVSSVAKKYLLANYYLNKGNKNLATNYINQIDIDNCDNKCRPLMIIAQPFSRFWFMASDFLSEDTSDNKSGTIAINKLAIPISSIQRYVYGVAILFILTLSLRGVLALYSDLKSTRIRKNSGH
ncbi:hypothetical protein ABN144_25915, partial [Klebsiella aerogenes]